MTSELALAERWLALDPQEKSQVELAGWLENAETEKISRSFAEPLSFGTAGLRGPVGPGPACMNPLTVRCFAQALAGFLGERFGKSVVALGYDARPDSHNFAQHIVTELLLFGHSVQWLDGPSPTPFVPFLVRRGGAKAGVVVTASHNPRDDAGIKVYDDLGIQIASPWDREIAERMGGASALGWIERLEASTQEPRESGGAFLWVTDAEIDEYFAWITGLARKIDSSRAPLKVAYTPLSGVGFASVSRLASELQVEVVVPAKEREPDGRFLHLPFPNPEERGVLDELLAAARLNGCDLALANDPDADRCALVLPTSSSLSAAETELAMVSGDELGVLLADTWLEALTLPKPLVVTTIVSSPAIEAVVAHYRGELRRTLTGFKWICRAANQDDFAFAYEEALGYCFGEGPKRPVLDKDGLAAISVLFGLARRQMAFQGASAGRALRTRLEQLALRDGLWMSAPRQVRALDEASRLKIFSASEELRRDPPREISGFRVVGGHDYLGAAASEPFAGRQDLQSFELLRQDGVAARVHVRPSGTEAKLKFYVHVGCRVSALEECASLRLKLTSIGTDLGAAFIERLGLVE